MSVANHPCETVKPSPTILLDPDNDTSKTVIVTPLNDATQRLGTEQVNSDHASNLAHRNSCCYLPLLVAGQKAYGLIDSGASFSIISSKMLKTFPQHVALKVESEKRSVITASGTVMALTERVQLEVTIINKRTYANHTLFIKFYVVECTPYTLIGADFLSELGAKLDVGQRLLEWGSGPGSIACQLHTL